VAEAEAHAARSQGASVDPAILAELERRVTDAEQRARDAELRLADLAQRRSTPQDATTPGAPRTAPPAADHDDAAPLPTGAADLRSRLARTAARKKHGSLPDEEHH
jgi:hypothetical protein